MNYIEKTMKTEKIYEGKIINLRVDTVELPDKKYSKREIVEHPGAVAIVPIKEDGKIVLVKQYRKAIEKNILEIPAGKIEIGEDIKECALRELKEETGIVPEKIEYMFKFYTSPGFSNEVLYLFLARKLNQGNPEPDMDEYIDTVEIHINELIDMINNGNIIDGKTITGILTADKVINS